jgi:hypothetical protein
MAQVKGLTERSLLLSALALRRRSHPATWGVGIAALGVANLLFCAYFERYIDAQSGQAPLLLLFAVESCFFLATIAGVFVGEIEGILHKTSTLPVAGRTRYAFVLLAHVRHPAVLVVWGTAVFAASAVGPATFAAICARTVLTLLLGLLILVCFSTALFARARSRATSAPIVAVAALFLLGIGFISAVASTTHFLGVLVPLQWTVDGIFAAQTGEPVRAVLFAFYLLLPSLACIVWGRRHV